MPPSEGPPKESFASHINTCCDLVNYSFREDADEYLRQVQWERLQCPEADTHAM